MVSIYQYVLIHVNPLLCCFFPTYQVRLWTQHNQHLQAEAVQVQVVGYPAHVRYIGEAHFAPGEWIGVELEPGCGIAAVFLGFLGRSWQFVRTHRVSDPPGLEPRSSLVWKSAAKDGEIMIIMEIQSSKSPTISCHPPYRPYRPYRSASAVGKNDGSVMEHRCALAERRTCQIDIDVIVSTHQDTQAGSGRHINVCDSQPLHESDMRFPTCYFEIFWVVGH